MTNRSALVAALVLAGAPDPAAAADAILAARAAAATAATGPHASYLAASDAAGDVSANLTDVTSGLNAFRDGLDDDLLDAEDLQAIADAALAAHTAKLNQDAVVAALTADTSLTDRTAAANLKVALDALDATLAKYGVAALNNPLSDGISISEFNAVVRAQTDAIAAASSAAANAAALSAAEASTSTAGTADALLDLLDANGIELSPDGSILIEHRSADIGLSPPNSAWMAFFGQFFDHGLDLVTKGGNGTIYIPLQDDDPLIAGADHVLDTADDLPPEFRFMTLSRTTGFDANGNLDPNGTEFAEHDDPVRRPEPDLHLQRVASGVPARVQVLRRLERCRQRQPIHSR